MKDWLMHSAATPLSVVVILLAIVNFLCIPVGLYLLGKIAGVW